MDNSNIAQINKIFRTWLRNVIFVFTGILIVFFNLPFSKKLEEYATNKNLLLLGYDEVLKSFSKATIESSLYIAFLLMPIFLCLIFYNSYIIIRIVKKNFYTAFSLSILFYYVILILTNSVLSGLICYILHNLGKFQEINSILLSVIWKNFWLQGIIIILTLFIIKCKSVEKLKDFYLPLWQRIRNKWNTLWREYNSYCIKKYKIILSVLLVCGVIILVIYLIGYNKNWICEVYKPIMDYLSKKR